MLHLFSPSENGLLGADVVVIETLDDVRGELEEVLLVLGDELLDAPQQVSLRLLVVQSETQQRGSEIEFLFFHSGRTLKSLKI